MANGVPSDLASEALDRLLGLSAELSGFAEMAAADSLLGPIAATHAGSETPTLSYGLRSARQRCRLSAALACRRHPAAQPPHREPWASGAAGSRRSSCLPWPGAARRRAADVLRGHGFSLSKARTIVEIARAVVDGDLDLEALEQLDDAAAIERLTRLRGIGRWSAEYVLLRGLGRLNVFPGDDVGAHNKLRRLLGIDTPLDYDAVRELVARWDPYAGLVYFHLLLDSLAAAGLIGSNRDTARANAFGVFGPLAGRSK